MAKSLTPSTAEHEGMSRSGLYRATRAGEYQRIARGVYIPIDAEAADWGWIEASTRRPDATICLTSALAHYELIDAIPTALDLAIPRGGRILAGSPSIAWHQFDKATFQIGRDELPIAGMKMIIAIYSPPRCIADAFRLRGKIGYETARDSLKEWLRQGGKHATLIEIASRLPRARGPLLQALETLA